MIVTTVLTSALTLSFIVTFSKNMHFYFYTFYYFTCYTSFYGLDPLQNSYKHKNCNVLERILEFWGRIPVHCLWVKRNQTHISSLTIFVFPEVSEWIRLFILRFFENR